MEAEVGVCTQYVRVREGPIDQYQADNAGACAPIQLLLKLALSS